MTDFVMSSWVGGVVCGTHEFTAPNADHAVGYCRGLMTDRLVSQGEALLALGCEERIDLCPEAKDSRRLNENTFVGTWHYVRRGDEVGLLWIAAGQDSSD